MNHFELLNLEQKYDIDLSDLKKQYLIKQSLYHPDRSNNDISLTEKLELSMQLNEAYKILKDDYLRSEYLLQLFGQKFDEHNLKNALNKDELEEIIELHEILDSIEELEELKSFKSAKLLQKNKIVNELTDCFEKNNISKALEITIRLKYLTNLVKNIDFKIKHANS